METACGCCAMPKCGIECVLKARAESRPNPIYSLDVIRQITPKLNTSGLVMIKIIVFILFVMSSAVTADEIEFIWSEDNPDSSAIYFSRYQNGAWQEKTMIAGDGKLNILPALGSDSKKNHLAVWATVDKGGGSVLKYSINEKDSWHSSRILSDLFKTNLAPVVIFDFNDRAWVFWAANDGTDDDIYATHWGKNHWTHPIRINNDNDVPDILPRATLDESNHLVVYWQQLQKNLTYREVSKRLVDGKWIKAQTNDTISRNASHGHANLNPPPFFKSTSRATFHFPNDRKNPSATIQGLEYNVRQQ